MPARPVSSARPVLPARSARSVGSGVGVVVVNHNGAGDTLACLEALLSMSVLPDVVAVCDNGSDDGSAEAILAFARTRFARLTETWAGDGWPDAPGGAASPAGSVAPVGEADTERDPEGRARAGAKKRPETCSEVGDRAGRGGGDGAAERGPAGDGSSGDASRGGVGAARYPARPGDEAGSSGPDFALVRAAENRGYAAGANLGLAALEAYPGCDFLWILNNDAAPETDCLAALLTTARTRPEAGVIGAVLVEHDRPDRVQCAGGCRYNPLTTMTAPYYAGLSRAELAHRPEPALDYVHGASLFLRADVVRALGGLCRDYFLYHEELDLCRRARRAGYGLALAAGAVVRHKGGATLARLRPEARQRLCLANYHENLSAFRYTRAHHPALLPAAVAFRLCGKTAVVLGRGQPFLLRPLFAALRDWLLGRAPAHPPKGRPQTPPDVH